MIPVTDPDIQQFILDHEHDDERDLILKMPSFNGVDIKMIATQISGRRKARTKLPTYYQTRGVVYPPTVNLEQCSSERTGQYKTTILAAFLGSPVQAVADLTGGLGVDSYCFSKIARRVDYVERDSALGAIALHNHRALGITHIHHHTASGQLFLSETTAKYDCIFLDPSRRTGDGNRVFKLSECEPNVVAWLPTLLTRASCVMIKVSPWLDVQQGLRELTGVEAVYILAVDNDCKELLYVCRPGFMGDPHITAVNLKKDSEEAFSFTFAEERDCVAAFSSPQRYLYEPHAAILKGGAFKLIASRYALNKLQAHTHLYTSDVLVSNFPGRVFAIESLMKSSPGEARRYFPDGMANVITRNYPLAPAQLLQKVSLKEGGTKFLLAFRGEQEKYLAVATRVR